MPFLPTNPEHTFRYVIGQDFGGLMMNMLDSNPENISTLMEEKYGATKPIILLVLEEIISEWFAINLTGTHLGELFSQDYSSRKKTEFEEYRDEIVSFLTQEEQAEYDFLRGDDYAEEDIEEDAEDHTEEDVEEDAEEDIEEDAGDHTEEDDGEESVITEQDITHPQAPEWGGDIEEQTEVFQEFDFDSLLRSSQDFERNRREEYYADVPN